MAAAGLLAAGVLGPGACAPRGDPAAQGLGEARTGQQLIARLGCGACHDVPGVAGARGQVGPPLEGIGGRTILAGVLPNTPQNLIRWIKSPQAYVPGAAMPNLELSENDARDIAAYLETLR